MSTTHPFSDGVLNDCRRVSSGTLAGLSGVRSYVAVDRVRVAWIAWVEAQPIPKFATWHDAWNAYVRAGLPKLVDATSRTLNREA
jgi:hypothetical protein